MHTQERNSAVSVVPERLVADSNVGVHNVLSRDKFREYVVNEMTLVSDTLSPHCGPFAKYGMIVTGTGNSAINPLMFTKDGIRLLAAVEHTALIEAYLKDAIAYIGTRVDAVAKDGTTTSMIFAAECIKNIMSGFPEDSLTTTERQNIMNRIIGDIKTELQQASLTHNVIPDRKPIQAGVVAFCQAMSSSGGNFDLARCCYELFSSVPPMSWEMIPVTQSCVETDVPFSINKTAYEYRMVAHFHNDNHRNTCLNTQYLTHNPLVFIYEDAISQTSLVTDHLGTYLATAIEGDVPVIVVATHIDSSFIAFIEQMNAGRKEKITLFSPIDTSIDKTGAFIATKALRLKSGAKPYTGTPLTLEHFATAERVEHSTRYIDFYGIIPGEAQDNIHPYYDESDTSSEYMTFVHELKAVIQKRAAMHDANSQIGTINMLQNITNMVVCCHNVEFVIGGSTHESIANFAVVQDVIGATIASLGYNFVINGLYSFLGVLLAASETDTSDAESIEGTFVKHVYNAFLSAIKVVIGIVYGDDSDHVLMDFKPREYVNALDRKDGSVICHDMTDYCEDVVNMLKGDPCATTPAEISKSYPVVQPIKIYEELMDRITELVLRIADTNKVIVPHGVFLNPTNTEQ